jgi:hypothetical protein
LTGEVRRAITRTFTRAGYPAGGEDPNPRKTRKGQQEPINFGSQGAESPAEGETPNPKRKKGGGDGTGCWCCCEGCDCCCDDCT